MKENKEKRQYLPPGLAVAAGDAASLTFRHLAAAVEVHLSNPMNVGIMVDSVVVEAAGRSLNGMGDFSLDAEGVPSVSGPAVYGANYARRSVRLTMPDRLFLAAGSSRALQLPVPPLPRNEELTVKVYGTTNFTFNAGPSLKVAMRNAPSSGGVKDFVFSHSATLGSRLQRTHLVKARAEIRPDGHLLDSDRSISRLSLFSLSDTKKVLFKRDQDATSSGFNWNMPTRAEIEYLLYQRPGARYVKVYAQATISEDFTYHIIIFPDGHTAESVCSLTGMTDLQASYVNSDSYQTISDFFFITRAHEHGFAVLKCGSQIGAVFNPNNLLEIIYYGNGYRLAGDGGYSLFFSGIGNNPSGTYALCIQPLIGA